MKRLLLLPLVAFLMASCSQDIEDNTPALQAVRAQKVAVETGTDADGNTTTIDTLQKDLYRAIDVRASYNDEDDLIIRGETDIESMTFNINNYRSVASSSWVTVVLGGSKPSVGAFEDVDGNIFSTASPNGSGKIRLRTNSDNTITATFRMIALRNGSRDTITFSQGNIFRAPIFSEEIEDEQPIAVDDSFFARVNTVAFNPTVISESQAGGNTVINGQTSSATITVSFPTDVSAGAYDLTAAGPYFAAYLSNSVSNAAQTGTLNIVSNDTQNRIVIGEFNFNTGQFTVTDGTFTINY